MAANIRKLFFETLKHEARKTGDPIHLSFIKWYVGKRFGAAATCDITDGPNDGGIDAIIVEPRLKGKEIYVLQSKFYGGFFTGHDKPLSITNYTEFDSMPTRFPDSRRFEEWISTVSADLRPKYRELRTMLDVPGTAVSWQLITLHSRSRAGEDRLQHLRADTFVYGAQQVQLFLMSKEGATPPADPLTLHFTKSMTVEDENRGVTSYVFAAYLKDFVDAMDHDIEDRLFARNVRLDLRSTINKQIRETYQRSPEDFWYSHNGITVVCTKAVIEGQSVRLVNPSVINGSQTLHSLRGVQHRDADAQVLARVLVVQMDNVRHPTKKFVNDVIYRMNQQNPMKASNLRANDDVQVELAAAFVPYKVFYERREGEWAARKRLLRNQGFSRLKSRELAQVLAASDMSFGPATAKGKIDALFEEPIYNQLFYQNFKEILLKGFLYGFIWSVIYETRIRGTQPRQRRQALWLTLHIVYQCIRRSPSYRALVDSPSVIRNLENYMPGSDRLWDISAGIVRDSWGAWKIANKNDRQLDPNNFFKTEGRARLLSTRLITKYERRAIVAARDLTAN